MKREMSILGGVVLAMVAAVGCHSGNGEAKSKHIEDRSKGEGTQLGSADLVVASDKAVMGIAAVPDIAAKNGVPTVIVMDRVDNQTSDHSANFQIFLARIRASLNQSGAKKNLVFVESRSKLEGIKDREGITDGARFKPSYALTGTFHDLPRAKTNYYLLTFQLVDLENGVVTWEDSYEVKL